MSIVYIIVALLMLTLIVSIHEFGHYIVGRKLGIGIVEYAIGMGPRLLSWKKTHKIKGTDKTETITYSVRALPLGGFCAFLGEDEANPDPRAMNNMPAWKRFLTVLAGPGMNFLLAFVITVGLIATGSIPNIFKTNVLPEVGSVMQDMPAQRAGFREGDIIVSIDGNVITCDQAGTNALKAYLASIEEGQEVIVTVKRGDVEEDLTLVPERQDGVTLLGVGLNSYYEEYHVGVLGAIPKSFSFMWNTVKETYKLLANLLKTLFTGGRIQEGSVTGVVGIVAGVSSDLKMGFGFSAGYGIFVILYYIMAISLSLGIMNLLPLPALDGGRLVVLLFEMVTGKHLNRRVEGIINLVGLGLLLLLVVFVTFSDIKTLLK